MPHNGNDGSAFKPDDRLPDDFINDSFVTVADSLGYAPLSAGQIRSVLQKHRGLPKQQASACIRIYLRRGYLFLDRETKRYHVNESFLRRPVA